MFDSRFRWTKVRQCKIVVIFFPACVSFECIRVCFFVCHWSLIRPLLTTYTKRPLRRCWWLSLGHGQVSPPSPFSPSLFSHPPLPSSLIDHILFNESCSSWLVISGLRSDSALKEGLDTFLTKPPPPAWNLNFYSSVDGVWSLTENLLILKSLIKAGPVQHSFSH